MSGGSSEEASNELQQGRAAAAPARRVSKRQQEPAVSDCQSVSECVSEVSELAVVSQTDANNTSNQLQLTDENIMDKLADE